MKKTKKTATTKSTDNSIITCEREEIKITNHSLDSNVETSFFYTNDKFINSIDNIDIIAVLLEKYPNLNSQNTDSVLRKTIIQILDDDEFIKYILNYYNMSIYDFFKVLYKQFGAIFNGIYLKKIKKTIENKEYAKSENKYY